MVTQKDKNHRLPAGSGELGGSLRTIFSKKNSWDFLEQWAKYIQR